jgi:hypothetical protein
MSTVARPSQETHRKKRSQKHRNGQIETATDFFAKVYPWQCKRHEEEEEEEEEEGQAMIEALEKYRIKLKVCLGLPTFCDGTG